MWPQSGPTSWHWCLGWASLHGYQGREWSSRVFPAAAKSPTLSPTSTLPWRLQPYVASTLVNYFGHYKDETKGPINSLLPRTPTVRLHSVSKLPYIFCKIFTDKLLSIHVRYKVAVVLILMTTSFYNYILAQGKGF